MIQAVILGATAIICVGVIISLFNRERDAHVHQASNRPSHRNGTPRSSQYNGDLRNRRSHKPSEAECVICFEVRPQVEIYPCGHKILCESCIMRLITESKINCPICRSGIKGYGMVKDSE